MRRAFAILLIASPSSQTSVLVQDAIQAGREYECPLCPLWIAGTKWEDWLPGCPTDWEPIDYRKETVVWKKSGLIWRVVPALSQIIADRSPNHMSLKAIDDHWHLPGYITILNPLSNHAMVAIKYNLYPSFRSLLDDIYLKYLIDQYDPFTYGNQWILAGTLRHPLSKITALALPWSWLLPSHKGDESAILKSFSAPLERCGLRPGTQWKIDQFPVIPIFGIATNNHYIDECFTNFWHHEKYLYRLVHLLKDAQHAQFRKIPFSSYDPEEPKNMNIWSVAPDKVNIDEYKFLIIFTSHLLDGSNSKKSAFIIG